MISTDLHKWIRDDHWDIVIKSYTYSPQFPPKYKPKSFESTSKIVVLSDLKSCPS